MGGIAQALALVLLLNGAPAIAHSGKTDATGCHTKKKTGEYHCHNKPAKEAKADARSAAPRGKQTIICVANVYNCSDFGGVHADAQHTYETCLDQVGTDVHDLDRDDDGVACEALQ